jgi:UDP-N-acetylglucosamine 2-epimerase (non-hydrolysing)
MKRVACIFGTRPEAIKLCPLIVAMRQHPELRPHVCVTGQHREMLDQVLQVFDVQPDVDLALMRANQTLAGLTARAITAIDAYLTDHRPDLVFVQGDTTTALAAALTSFYHRISVGHVEAGLRTWERFSPFPEEINRVLTSRLVDLHFAPTETSKQNLLREGVDCQRIFVTGNTVIDALLLAVEKVKTHPPHVFGLPDALQPASTAADAPRIVLITGHRRENFGEGLQNICRAIAELACRFPDVHFVYPVHLNPNVREPVERILGGGSFQFSVFSFQQGEEKGTGSFCRNGPEGALHKTCLSPFPESQSPIPNPQSLIPPSPNIHLIEPLPYLEFVAMMNRSTLLLTDSGGLQEEAPSLGKPVLVMRDTTERPEAVTVGTAKLVGTDPRAIIAGVTTLLTDPRTYAAMSSAANPYGDGQACGRILAATERFLAGLSPSPLAGEGRGEGRASPSPLAGEGRGEGYVEVRSQKSEVRS